MMLALAKGLIEFLFMRIIGLLGFTKPVSIVKYVTKPSQVSNPPRNITLVRLQLLLITTLRLIGCLPNKVLFIQSNIKATWNCSLVCIRKQSPFKLVDSVF